MPHVASTASISPLAKDVLKRKKNVFPPFRNSFFSLQLEIQLLQQIISWTGHSDSARGADNGRCHGLSPRTGNACVSPHCDTGQLGLKPLLKPLQRTTDGLQAKMNCLFVKNGIYQTVVPRTSWPHRYVICTVPWVLPQENRIEKQKKTASRELLGICWICISPSSATSSQTLYLCKPTCRVQTSRSALEFYYAHTVCVSTYSLKLYCASQKHCWAPITGAATLLEAWVPAGCCQCWMMNVGKCQGLCQSSVVQHIFLHQRRRYKSMISD